MKSLLACVVLVGLPLVASADDSAAMAQCAEVAQRFSSEPRSLGISELDRLKTCIMIQRDAVAAANPQAPQQLLVVRSRMMRTSLKDDL